MQPYRLLSLICCLLIQNNRETMDTAQISTHSHAW